MKRQKDRITHNQFCQALLEQINHARSMTVPLQAVSSAAMFTCLVGSRLFGKDVKMPADLHTVFQRLMEDAKEERARIMAEQKRQESKIIMPGQPLN